jgi:ethanolamine utilization protein EutN
MQLAKVTGQVVATHKVDSLMGVKLLIVQPLSSAYEPVGKPSIAVDATAQAGIGDYVLIEGGREAAVAIEPEFNPADQAILAIVDTVYTPEQ